MFIKHLCRSDHIQVYGAMKHNFETCCEHAFYCQTVYKSSLWNQNFLMIIWHHFFKELNHYLVKEMHGPFLKIQSSDQEHVLVPNPWTGVRRCATRLQSKLMTRSLAPSLVQTHDSEVRRFHDHITLFSSKTKLLFETKSDQFQILHRSSTV